MDIGIYIADLLRNQEEVSLPGLGTFTKQRIPGSYDSTNNSFLPPRYQVSFDDRLTEPSGLSDYISLKKNLSTSSAEYFVKKFAAGLSDLLETSGIAEVKPLGIIRQKSDALTFEPSTDFDIGGRFYGLKPIAELRKTVSQPVSEPIVPAAISTDSIEDFINYQGDEEIEDEQEYVEEPRRNRLLLLIIGAFLFGIIAAVLLYFFNPQTRNLIDKMLPTYSSSVPVKQPAETFEKPAPVVIPDSTKAILPSTTPDSAGFDSTSSVNPVIKEPVSAPMIKIEIIGGSYGRRSEAEAYVKAMKAKGLDAKIAEDMPGKLFKVSLASFQDDQTAQNELNRIVQQVEKKAWIAKYKPKKTQ
ncbi:HU domain-containing protein [Daejeonella lutea]|uniref:Uncharacterized protein n=1 Tax=Daejeonella lutea TaxID=572036 RepID=A0A1T5A203_9SPHI|nr:SPOR domain-containing protein [Daejeonella lutea]SKB28885.1 hypothetical protein SAMN05661099_0210 [Daejeonella lutea]